MTFIPQFLTLTGEARWKKRAVQLGLEYVRSPWEAKIVSDYHWLETTLSALMIGWEFERAAPTQVDVQLLAALRFAGMIVEVEKRLSQSGRTALAGRLRDGLKTDFSSLYREMETALLLLEEGYDVDFPDLEGTSRVDLFFRKGPTKGEVECKSQSVDAGRKIHRKDFYRFIDVFGPTIESRAVSGANEIMVITVADRLSGNAVQQRELASACEKVFANPNLQPFKNDWYSLELQSIDVLDPSVRTNPHDLSAECRRVFGAQCHAAGMTTESGGSLVVVRSRKPDDTSKPILDALKKAQSQLSGTLPGFIAVQLDDIEPADLTLPHLCRRLALLTNHLFHVRDSNLLAGVYFCPYRSLHAANDKVVRLRPCSGILS